MNYRGGVMEEFRNAFQKQNNGLIQIILFNIAVFVVLNTLGVILWLMGQTEFRTMGCGFGSSDIFCQIILFLQLPSDPLRFITHPWTIITYFFTHLGFFHILFNMLFLYWFGKLIQEFIGDNKVIVLYVLGGILGGMMYILIYNVLPQFSDLASSSHMLGASAGVFAIVVGAATFMPNYTIYLFLFGPVRIKYIAIFYVLLSFFNVPGNNAGGAIAHLGGAAIGYIYVKQLQKGNDLGSWVISLISFFKSFFIRQSKIKVSYSSGKKASSFKSSKSATSTKSTPNQKEIDDILDKISHSGYESLSKDEKQKLFNASKK